MKRTMTAFATLVLAVGVAAVPASAEPVNPAAKPVDSLLSAPAETPAQALATGKIKLANLKQTPAKSVPGAKAGTDTNTPKGAPPPPMPPAKKAEKRAACPTTWCYLYNGGRQDVANDLGTGTPKVSDKRGVTAIVKVGGHQGQLAGAHERHALQELAVQNGDNAVEIGATVNPVLNGDYKVTLFGFAWVNDVATCYNGTCGNFIANTAASCQVGVTEFTAGQSIALTLFYENDPGIEGWWLGCGSEWVGRYAETVWSGATPSQTFHTMQYMQAYGEIVSKWTKPCSDMGLGLIASNANAARFGTVRYYAANGTVSGAGVNLSTFRIPAVEAGAPYANTFGEGPAGAQQSFRLGGPMHWGPDGVNGPGAGVIGNPC